MEESTRVRDVRILLQSLGYNEYSSDAGAKSLCNHFKDEEDVVLHIAHINNPSEVFAGLLAARISQLNRKKVE